MGAALTIPILQGVNIALPAVINFITIFRHKDGSATVISELNAESQASADIHALIANWNSAHPASATAGAPAPPPVSPQT